MCYIIKTKHLLTGPPGGPQATYLESTKRDQDKNFQEIEAQNRWSVLEAHSPGHNITALNHKMALTGKGEQPPTFYGHEGRYNEERAGLYKTSYSPERLAYNMNALDVSGPEIMNTRTSHLDALNLPSKLNHDMKDAFRYSRTFNYTSPNLSGDRREPHEHSVQHNQLKEFQKSILQPNVQNARVKVQENGIILKDSTMGDSYNTKKFLQENEIGKFSRYEPNIVMSTTNQNLHNVRKASSTKSKSVKFSDNISVAQSMDTGIIRLSSAPTRGSPRMDLDPAQLIASDPGPKPSTQPVTTTQYTSVEALYNPANDKFQEDADKENDDDENKMQYDPNNMPKIKFYNIESKLPDETTEEGTKPFISYSSTIRKRPITSDPSSEYRNEFSSKGTNFIPSNLQHSLSFDSAYKAQFPVHHIGYKNDARFQWQPGYGEPRPQTSLVKMQDSFDKTSIRRNFLGKFSESNPDLRQNITRGKKHDFWGINGQLIHG